MIHRGYKLNEKVGKLSWKGKESITPFIEPDSACGIITAAENSSGKMDNIRDQSSMERPHKKKALFVTGQIKRSLALSLHKVNKNEGKAQAS